MAKKLTGKKMIGNPGLRTDELWVRFQEHLERHSNPRIMDDEDWLPLWWAFQGGAGRTPEQMNNGPAAPRPMDHRLWPDFVEFMSKSKNPVVESDRDSWIFHWRLFLEGSEAEFAAERRRANGES